ncbi:MAG: hypothetical protein HYR85_20705 [Planctomycetes bacterium]|nr:hypothetical protein [Planctomycetota bacterium]MBI3846130.1 hypothetical protein [Planctomycetota bacterium]
MKWLVGILVAVCSASPATKWTFDDLDAGKAPKGFSFGRTGDGPPGTWVVRDAADGKGRVLAQTSDDATDDRFPVAVADAPVLADVSLSVRFRPVSGKVDQAGGLVFRYTDPNSYYLVRANALEDNCRIYHVVGGKRVQFGDKSVKVATDKWHTLKVTAQGKAFHVWLDGGSVIEATDDTIKVAGKVGVWTKADSVTEFDDLDLESLEPQ